MAKKDEKKSVVKSTEKPTENQVEQNPEEQKPKKKGRFDLSPYAVHDSEEAKRRGRNGGIKSGESKRAKKNARELCQYLLAQMTKNSNVRKNLVELGFEDNEMNNLAALYGRLFTMAMSGDLNAFNTLMKMAGYDPEENRKERESVNSDKRRERELEVKVSALTNNPDGLSASLNFNNEDDNGDVVIYMPKIMEEKDCQAEEEEAPIEDEQPQGE